MTMTVLPPISPRPDPVPSGAYKVDISRGQRIGRVSSEWFILHPSVDEFVALYRNHEVRAAELHPANKASLFAALRDAGIASMTVNFDGYGDSGQIEDITAVSADQSECEIPATIVELRQLSFGEARPSCLSQPLQEAIGTLSYAFLESMAAGRTTKARSATSRSTSPPGRSRSITTNGSHRPKTTATSFEGGCDGTLLSPRAVEREEVGRRSG